MAERCSEGGLDLIEKTLSDAQPIEVVVKSPGLAVYLLPSDVRAVVAEARAARAFVALVAECLAEHDAAKDLFYRSDQPDSPLTARIRAALAEELPGERRAESAERGRELATRLDPKDVRAAFDRLIVLMRNQAEHCRAEGEPVAAAVLKTTSGTAVDIREELLAKAKGRT